jgi:hypothetical protein
MMDLRADDVLWLCKYCIEEADLEALELEDALDVGESVGGVQKLTCGR